MPPAAPDSAGLSRVAYVGLLFVLASVACGSGVDPGPCGAIVDHVPPCLSGTAGHTCVMASGANPGLVCVGTTWMCPSGSVPQTACGCFGTQPGAECPGTACGGMPAPSYLCLPGTEGRACGDVAREPVCTGGAWGCPAGTVRGSACGCSAGPERMVGDPCPVDAGSDGASDAQSDAAGDAAGDVVGDGE